MNTVIYFTLVFELRIGFLKEQASFVAYVLVFALKCDPKYDFKWTSKCLEALNKRDTVAHLEATQQVLRPELEFQCILLLFEQAQTFDCLPKKEKKGKKLAEKEMF